MNFLKKYLIIIILILLFHLFLLAKFQFTAWPEMLSFPYMINNGFLIYKDFHHAYQPLLTIILSGVYKIFGYDILVLKIFSWSIFLFTDLLIFIILIKNKVGYIKTFLIMMLYVSGQVLFEGNGIWYDSFVTSFVLLSLLFINTNALYSGFFLALAIVVKQQSGLLILPFIIYIYLRNKNFRDVLMFTIGGIIPVVFCFGYFMNKGIFSDYLFWTFRFPIFELPKIQSYAQNITSPQLIIIFSLILPLLFSIKNIITKKFNILLLSILFILFITSFPRFSLLHLQPFLAIYFVLIAICFNYMVMILPIFFAYLLYKSRFLLGLPERFYSDKTFGVQNSIVYYLGPHGISYIKNNNLPPKPWIENYVWHFEIKGMQQKMLDGWRVDPPTYVYWSKPQVGNWYDLGTYQPEKIVKYIKENYQKIDEQDNVEVWKLNK